MPATTTRTQNSPGTEAPSPPSTLESTVTLSTTPQALDLPPIPPGPTDSGSLARGYFPRASEAAALPDVALEVATSTTYTSTFGPSMPTVGPFVVMLQNAAEWTTQRIALEAYLAYAKGQEGLAWKALRPHLDQAKEVYAVTVSKNTDVPVLFPALTRLFDGNVSVAKKGHATRKRKKAAMAAEASSVSATASASRTSEAANGGAAE